MMSLQLSAGRLSGRPSLLQGAPARPCLIIARAHPKHRHGNQHHHQHSRRPKQPRDAAAMAIPLVAVPAMPAAEQTVLVAQRNSSSCKSLQPASLETPCPAPTLHTAPFDGHTAWFADAAAATQGQQAQHPQADAPPAADTPVPPATVTPPAHTDAAAAAPRRAPPATTGFIHNLDNGSFSFAARLKFIRASPQHLEVPFTHKGQLVHLRVAASGRQEFVVATVLQRLEAGEFEEQQEKEEQEQQRSSSVWQEHTGWVVVNAPNRSSRVYNSSRTHSAAQHRPPAWPPAADNTMMPTPAFTTATPAAAAAAAAAQGNTPAASAAVGVPTEVTASAAAAAFSFAVTADNSASPAAPLQHVAAARGNESAAAQQHRTLQHNVSAPTQQHTQQHSVPAPTQQHMQQHRTLGATTQQQAQQHSTLQTTVPVSPATSRRVFGSRGGRSLAERQAALQNAGRRSQTNTQPVVAAAGAAATPGGASGAASPVADATAVTQTGSHQNLLVGGSYGCYANSSSCTNSSNTVSGKTGSGFAGFAGAGVTNWDQLLSASYSSSSSSSSTNRNHTGGPAWL